MAGREAERKDKEVRDTMLAMLRERVADPTKMWRPTGGIPQIERVAGNILADAGLIAENGLITLAGMDYYRKETANPVLKWLRSNWFAVIVAGCTIGVSVWGIVGG